jgi:hypothetical protein
LDRVNQERVQYKQSGRLPSSDETHQSASAATIDGN